MKALFEDASPIMKHTDNRRIQAIFFCNWELTGME